MGTDYPFDMADSDPVGHVMNCPEITDLAKQAIYYSIFMIIHERVKVFIYKST